MKKRSSYSLSELKPISESAHLQAGRRMSDQVHYDNEGFVDMEDDESEGSAAGREGSMDTSCNPEFISESSMSHLFSAIHTGNMEGVEKILDQEPELINSTGYGGLTPLHSASHMQQLDVLKFLISRGAKVNVYDSLGNSALHVAVKEIWHDGVKELLQQGASPNEMSQPPNNVGGMVRETPIHTAVRMGDKISTSLLLKHKPDMNIRDGNNQTVFHLAVFKKNLLILKELLADTNLQVYMKNLDKDGHSIYHAALSSTSYTHNERLIVKVIQCIFTHHENLDVSNILGETPLIRACHLGLPKVAQFFIDNGANPAHVTNQKQSALHAACISGNSDTLNHLLKTGRVEHLVSSLDNYGNHPFYYAAENSSLECCRLLLKNGERLGNVYKGDVSNCKLVIKYLPNAMQLFRDLFNTSIKLSNKPRHHPDYNITFDYSSLMNSEKAKVQCSIISEMAGTPMEALIKHPLIESFLYIKWCRIRSVFYLKVFQYFIYLMIHTVFIVMTFGPKPKDWSDDEFTLMMFRIFHAIFLVIIAVPDIVVTFANFKKYMTHWETYTNLAALTSSIIVICTVSDKIVDDITLNKENARVSPKRLFASLSIVLGWIELMMLFGRFPTLGAYILMVTKVGKSIFKFLFAFISVLIGFTLGFHILFHRLPIFADFNISFVKVLMMLKGEISYSQFVDQKGSPFHLYPQILMSVFLFLVTIIMSNLLIGLAVKGVPDLKRHGKIKRLIKQASYLLAFENLLAFISKIKCFPRRLLSILISRLTIDSTITIYPSKEFRKPNYMRTIPAENISEAINLGSCEEAEDIHEDSEDEVIEQLKSFKMKYSSDRRTQSHKIKDLSDMCVDIKKQLTDLSQQIQLQIQQSQNLYNQLSQKPCG